MMVFYRKHPKDRSDIETVEMEEIQDSGSIHPLHHIVRNDFVQMPLHDFLQVDKGEKILGRIMSE